jgi:GT2 family glycosyltransferase
MYTEETDFCYRAKKAGWSIYYNPKWNIVHLGGASGEKWSFVTREFEGVKLFYKKHYPLWQYPVLRVLLKIGSLWRIVVFGVLKGRGAAKAYAESFFKA